MIAKMSLKVLEHDELPTLVALLGPAAAVVLVLLQAPHLHMGGAPLAQGGSFGTLVSLGTDLIMIFGFIYVLYLVGVQLEGLYHLPADTLDLPVLALGHVLLELPPRHGLVALLAQHHVPGAVHHVHLVVGRRNEPPATIGIVSSAFLELQMSVYSTIIPINNHAIISSWSVFATFWLVLQSLCFPIILVKCPA